jgi:hypothetical protein
MNDDTQAVYARRHRWLGVAGGGVLRGKRDTRD